MDRTAAHRANLARCVEAFEQQLKEFKETPQMVYGIDVNSLTNLALGAPEPGVGVSAPSSEVLCLTLHNLYAILANMRASVVLETGHKRIGFVNQAWCDAFNIPYHPFDLVGVTSDELLERTRGAYLNPDMAIARIREIMRYGKPVEGEEVIICGKTYLRDYIPLYHNGTHNGCIWQTTDITKHKAKEAELCKVTDNLEQMVERRTRQLLNAHAELERSRRMGDIGRLASTIAHELRNPLSVIKLAVHNVKRKVTDPALAHHFENITKKIAESDSIIQNLLMFTRIKKQHFEQVVLHELVDDCIATVKAKHVVAGGTVISDSALGSRDTIEADATQIRMVLNNILDNAFQALPEQDGQITVTAAIENNRCFMTIRDNGSGIPVENVDKVFDPFFTTKSRGTGLGLAVCREIIEMHHGTIGLESQVGRGTTFRISLPVKQPPT